jgi:hypothetical protein
MAARDQFGSNQTIEYIRHISIELVVGVTFRGQPAPLIAGVGRGKTGVYDDKFLQDRNAELRDV